MTDYLQAEGVPEDDYWPVTWNQIQYRGRFHAMSISTIVNLWFYKKDRMSESGNDSETAPGALEKWEEAGRAMTEMDDNGQVERIGFIPPIPSLDPHDCLGTFGADVWDDGSATVNLETPKSLISGKVQLLQPGVRHRRHCDIPHRLWRQKLRMQLP